MRAAVASMAAALTALAAAGCGGGSGASPCPGGRPGVRLDAADQARAARAVVRLSDLPDGWRSLPAKGSVAQLGPSLSGLTIRGEADSPALVDRGLLVRSAATVLSSPEEAAEAFERASDEEFPDCLAARFDTAAVASMALSGARPAVAYRLRVSRPAEPGTDTVEVVVLRRSSVLAVVELVSAEGFDAPARDRLVARLSARLAEAARE